MPAIPRSRHSAYRAYLAASRRALALAVETFGRPDLLHAHVVLPAGWAACRLATEIGIPVVLTEHSGPFSVHMSHGLDRKLVASTLNGVDALIAVSPSLESQMRSFQATPTTVIGNAIDTDHFAPRANAAGLTDLGQPFDVLSVALLTESKRIDLLLDAFAIAAANVERPMRLTIVGDGPVRAKLEAQATALGIADRTVFRGELTRSDVRDSMQRCDAFVLPSDAETFGVVVAEAMACERAVITTRSGGPEYIADDRTAVLVPVGDKVAIAEALIDLVRGVATPDVVAARRRIVTRFGLQAFLDAIGSVYERVAARPWPPATG